MLFDVACRDVCLVSVIDSPQIPVTAKQAQ